MYGTCRKPARFLSVKAHEKSSFRVRNPIRSRSESDQIPYGVRSGCVRSPIGLRTVTVGKGGDLRSKEWGIGSFKLGIRAAEVDIIIRIVLFLFFLFVNLRYNF